MLPYDRKRAFRKQWLYLGTFLTVIFLTVTNLEMVAEVLRSGRKLSAGWTESYILKVLTGDGIRLYFPLLCTVPYATGFVDEYKSGIYKFVLVRKERKKYIISKAITNAVAGGSILVAGTVAFILCTWMVFLPMEKGFSWMIIQNFLGEYGQLLCQFFAFGALEAEIGMWISTLVNHRYMAWLAPFMSEYLLIILCERYFPECRVFYPPDWLVVQADWPLHGWSVFFWLLFLTGIAGYAFADAARRRIGYA